MRAVLRLIRLPNTLTAAADVAAGAALGGMAVASLPVLIVALGSMALYGAGVAMNDVVDIEKDKQLHRDRPLPSGAVSPQFARNLIILLAIAAILSGPIAASIADQPVPPIHFLFLALSAALTMGFAALYNITHASKIHVSRILMGATRASNLFRGVLLAWCWQGGDIPNAAPAAMAVISHGLLIYLVTAISEREGSTRQYDYTGFIGGMAAVVAVQVTLASVEVQSDLGILSAVLGVAWCIWATFPLRRSPGNAGAAVGRLIGGWALYDAIVILSGSYVDANLLPNVMIVGALFPLGKVLRRLTASEAS